MRNKERLVGIIMSTVMSLAMGIVASFLIVKTNPNALMAHSVASIYISNIVLSAFLGFVISLVLPFGKLGGKLARKAHAYPPSLKFILINAIPITIGNNLIISLVLSLVGVLSARSNLPDEIVEKSLPPLHVMWLGSWVKMLLPTLIISYILSIVLAPLVAKMVGFKGGEGRPPMGQGPKDL